MKTRVFSFSASTTTPEDFIRVCTKNEFFSHSKGTGAVPDIGKGKGAGYNINIPIEKKHLGDLEYYLAFSKIIVPIIQEYEPEMIFISAGFDCGGGDLLGPMDVSKEGFGVFTELLRASIPNHKVVLALEGGYTLKVTSSGMLSCVQVLSGTYPEKLKQLQLQTDLKSEVCPPFTTQKLTAM